MNKSELKAKWGNYTDIDKLVYDIGNLLTTYRHRNSEHGVCMMLDKYFTQKEPLINLLMESKNYAGDMRIKMRKEFARDNVKSDVHNFCCNFSNDVGAPEALLKRETDEGKTITDYIKIGRNHITPKQLLEKTKTINFQSTPFTYDGYTLDSSQNLEGFKNFLNIFYYITEHILSDKNAADFAGIKSDIKLAKGMKTSRAFNRVCDTYGISKLPKYNKLFAQYADMVSGLKRELDYYISVNPYDYLTMSFGNSWSSCHTIDKTNIRRAANNYSGQYCGGTLSYMLDTSSIITYVVEADGDPKECGKIYRNMFHYGNNVLIQGRIYPQGNDGSTDLYTLFREFMHAEMAELLKSKDASWKTLVGTSYCSDYTISDGVHYKDYVYVRDCNVSYMTSKERQRGRVSIGTLGVCPNCGEPINFSSALSHSGCRATY